MQQVTQAYVVLLSSQFQRFCRDLHTEATLFLVTESVSGPVAVILNRRLMDRRKLDLGNPNLANIGGDYDRLGVDFWNEVRQLDARNGLRLTRLEEMNRWRNAIAHHDFRSPHLAGRTQVLLADVRGWRAACQGLAIAFDAVMRLHLHGITGKYPW